MLPPKIQKYISNGFDFGLGIIDIGRHEGYFKAWIDNGEVGKLIECIGSTQENAIQALENLLN